jgi:hypothetical protein
MDFGKPTQKFSLQKVNALIQDLKFDEAKTYFHSYFIQCLSPCGIWHWKPLTSEKFQFLDHKTLQIAILKKIKPAYYRIKETGDTFKRKKCDKKKSTHQFDLAEWFTCDNDLMIEISVHPLKPRIYTNNGETYLNLFDGFPHVESKPFKDYDKTTRNQVNLIWNHIFEVWSSSNNKSYEYTKTWLAHAVTGHKMPTVLYLRSGQGTGKSCITEDFIQGNVLSDSIVCNTSDAKVVGDGWNQQLKGKVMLILEEPESASRQQWFSLANSIKHIATSKSLEIKQKHKDSYFIPNCLSLIINTNNNALRMEKDDRRTFALDVSHKYVKNTKYFNKLHEAIGNKKCGEAFFYQCQEIYEATKKTFKPFQMPNTEAKKENIIENLETHYQFIKDKFLYKMHDMNKSFTSLYEFYKNYCKNRNKIPIGKPTFSRRMTAVGITCIQKKIKNTNTKIYKYSYEQLKNLYEKKGWIHESDCLGEVSESESEDEFVESESEEEEEEQQQKIEQNPKKIIKFLDALI